MVIRAVVFDVFGTLVDWRRGITDAVTRVVGSEIDGAAFADAWRAEYQPSMEPIRSGARPWCNLDVLHAESLDRVADAFGAELQLDQRQALVAAWHRLPAWPEVKQALSELRPDFWIAPLSNGHIALSIELARHNEMLWDAVLGAELRETTSRTRPSIKPLAVDFSCPPTTSSWWPASQLTSPRPLSVG
jgi:2-haloacid dehalogenase